MALSRKSACEKVDRARNSVQRAHQGVLEAVGSGRTELVLRAATSETRITIEVAGRAQPQMKAIPHSAGPGEKRGYPAPMVLLTALFARRANDAQAYEKIVVPFLDRAIMEFPVAGYPRNPPAPPLSDLLKDWRVVVRFGDRFERVYRRGDSDKTLLVEFQGV